MLGSVNRVSYVQVAQVSTEEQQIQSDPVKEGLSRLKEEGIKLDNYGEKWREDQKAKLSDSAFVDALIFLHKAGVKIDTYFFDTLTPEKAKDAVYLRALTDLMKVGLKIDSGDVSNLTLEEARDPVYMQALLELLSAVNANSFVKSFILANLTIEMAHDKVYMGRVMEYARAGLTFFYYPDWDTEILSNLTPEKVKDDAWHNEMLKFVKAGFEVSNAFLKEFTLEAAKNPEFISQKMKLIEVKKEALNRLRGAGVPLSGRPGIVPVRVALTYEKASSLEFMNALIELKKSGMWIDGEVVEFMTLEKAKDRDFINALKKLRKAGVIDNHQNNGWVVRDLTVEKARDPLYLNALIRIRRAGIRITGDMIIGFSVEESHDPAKVLALIKEYKSQ